MENENGKWRFTSPTHTVLAFQQALKELEAEGGIETRYSRYLANNHVLRQKMTEMGFQPFIQEYQGHSSPLFFTLRTGDLILIILSVFKAKWICDLSRENQRS